MTSVARLIRLSDAAEGGGGAVTRAANPEAVTGVQLAQGLGVQPAKGFWADAWSRVVTRPAAIFGLVWLAIIAFFAVFSPLIASGHPILLEHLDEAGRVIDRSSPLLQHLKPSDVMLALGTIGGAIWLFAPWGARTARAGVWIVAAGALAAAAAVGATFVSGSDSARELSAALTLVAAALGGVGTLAIAGSTVKADRGPMLFLMSLQGAAILVIAAMLAGQFAKPQRELPAWMFTLKQRPGLAVEVAAAATLFVTAIMAAIPVLERRGRQAAIFAGVGLVALGSVATTWHRPLATFEYREMADAGRARAVHTLIPFSPSQSSTRLYVLPPGTSLEQGLAPRTETGDIPPRAQSDSSPRFLLGTDPLGQDVLAQLLHACRLSISIGLVSTGIAVIIGVTIGALMGYFGGWVDLVLYRVVEVFMAIPVLFLLIVAAAVLPRNTYVMMAIIGCVTWTGAARFTRAEFYKLRSQDFVQAARAMGLPLRSILFRHMLPNGVTPVLVDSSFGIAAAILAEATLSYLGLGPEGQPSWGALLSSATSTTGTLLWWLAIFPGVAIFLTVLSYNLIGEAMRDAIDPKLKKARV